MDINPNLANIFARIANRAIQERAAQSGRPFLMLHLVTNRCMCNCKSCLWKNNDYKDVPLDDLKRFYAQAAEQGIMAAAISGGEPFLRADLGELLRFVKQEAGMCILLFNTGWFLAERMDEALPHIDILLLSLDAARPERYDEIRGLDGLFQRMMEGVDLARKKYPDLPIHFNACVQKGIGDEIDGLIKLTQDKGLKISFDVITEYRHGDSGGHFTETHAGLDPDELREVCSRLIQRKRQGAPIINSERYFQYFVDGKPGYKCHFPKLVMQVDGRGNLDNCLDLDHPLGNFTETPLAEIMESDRFKELRARAESCCSCNSPTMVDLSNVWEDPKIIFEKGGIQAG